jgi:hypothetical protein
MKKLKFQKSLKLTRETLASLDHGSLREPVGAAVTLACTTDCNSASTCGYRNTQCVGW